MKPKHRIYCRDCGRQKMLFESEKKALTFIKFNGDAVMANRRVNQKAPVRAYYCECCGGWHITSKAVEDVDADLLNRTENIVKAYEDDLHIGKQANRQSECICGEMPVHAKNFICQYNRVTLNTELGDVKRGTLAAAAWNEGKAMLKDDAAAEWCEKNDVELKMDELMYVAIKCAASAAKAAKVGNIESSQLTNLLGFTRKHADGEDLAAIDSAFQPELSQVKAEQTDVQKEARIASHIASIEQSIKSMEVNLAVNCPGGALMVVPKVVEQLTGLSKMDGVSREMTLEYINRVMALRDEAAEAQEKKKMA